MPYTDTKKADGFYIQWAAIYEASPDEWDGECDPPEYLVNVFAEARCMVVVNGTGTLFELRSPGLYNVGVNDRADPYLAEVYAEQKAELLATISRMRDPQIDAHERTLERF